MAVLEKAGLEPTAAMRARRKELSRLAEMVSEDGRNGQPSSDSAGNGGGR